MKTIKLLSFFIVATVIFSSCDAIADSLSKDVAGSIDINFTTTGGALTAKGLQKVKIATNDVFIYDSVMTLSHVDVELAKVGMDRKNIRSLELDSVTFELPTDADALKFTGVKLYIETGLTAQQEGIVSGKTFKLVIKDKNRLEYGLEDQGDIHIQISNPTPIQKGIVVKAKLHYTAKISAIKS